MSLQIDLLHPDLGFFEEDLDLTDPEIYAPAKETFGKATTLPPFAYRSKAFLELENEKIWTRDWVAIGLSLQIPNRGDLLPFTTGFHGVHVQRGLEGELSARFNFHQHGGCRFVPEQCRTGKQTKCSIASCNYTRDANAMAALEDGENSPEMYKFVGINPDKLKPVRSGCLGPVVFVNVDPCATDFHPGGGAGLSQCLKELATPMLLAAHEWLDFKCNWKLFGAKFVSSGRSVRVHEGETAPVAVEAKAAARDGFAFAAGVDGAEMLKLFWLFPNLLVAIAPTHVVTIIMQATGMGDTLCRVSVLLPEDSEHCGDVSDLSGNWHDALRRLGANAEKTHRRMAEWGTSSQPETVGCDPATEANFARYAANRYVLSKVLTEHELYWNAPIMDARMMQRKGSK